MKQELKDKIEELSKEFSAEGYSFILSAAKYDADDAWFTTKLSLNSVPELGVTEDHIVLDILREISNEWSGIVH